MSILKIVSETPSLHRYHLTSTVYSQTLSFHFIFFPFFPIILRSFHDVQSRNALRAGCFHLHVSFGKALDEFWWNLARTMCHWKLLHTLIPQFPKTTITKRTQELVPEGTKKLTKKMQRWNRRWRRRKYRVVGAAAVMVTTMMMMIMGTTTMMMMAYVYSCSQKTTMLWWKTSD